MDKIFFALYVYDVVNGFILTVLMISAVILIGLILGYVTFFDPCCKEGEEKKQAIKGRKTIIKVLKLPIATLVVFTLLNAFIPKKYLFYSYIGYKTVQELKIVQKFTPLGEKIYKLINKKLDSLLKN